MLRSFTISLLFLALVAVGFEGYRERERTRTGAAAPTNTAAANTDANGSAHAMEGGIGFGPIK
jgi:hypothetical protein